MVCAKEILWVPLPSDLYTVVMTVHRQLFLGLGHSVLFTHLESFNLWFLHHPYLLGVCVCTSMYVC